MHIYAHGPPVSCSIDGDNIRNATLASSTSLVWLITGCSSGFGFQLCLVALKAGHKVIATSRNPSKTPGLVQEIEKLGGIWLALDVNCGIAEINQLVEMGSKTYGKIVVLVNNAAIGILGAIEDMRMVIIDCSEHFNTLIII